MARKRVDPKAKQRKQAIILIVGLVLLAGVMAFQLPRMMKAANPASAPAPAPSASAETTAAPAATQLVDAPAVPAPGTGQLVSFSLFESKDPFVQQVKPEALLTPAQVGGLKAQSSGTADAAAKKAAATAAAAAAAGAGAPAGQAGSTPSVPMNLNMAMLRVNGNLHFVELKKRFPKSDRAFELKTIKPGRVSISVADGNFVGGGTLVLRVGRTTTLVNTATGARYVVKLLWVGDESQLTRFNDAK